MKVSVAVVVYSVIVSTLVGRVVASDVEPFKENTSVIQALSATNRLATNGYKSLPGQFLYHAYMHIRVESELSNQTRGCDGALITSNYILSVTQGCLKVGSMQTIRNGTAILAFKENMWEQRISFSGSAINLHPYESIGLVRLDTPATLNKYVQPIRLPMLTDLRTYEGMEGTTSNEYRSYVRNRVMSNAHCSQERPNFNATDMDICTDRYIGGAFCTTSLGSPLTIEDENGVILIGLAYRIYHCDYNYPTVYARVSSFRDWIHNNSDYKVEHCTC
uniref:Peptidase S1 domain-containing protein n=1 Tax=Anopheles quadriannulatus TaxID=34691 RepID=A0A1I8JWB9_ANOQN